jgi:hypothetical protein
MSAFGSKADVPKCARHGCPTLDNRTLRAAEITLTVTGPRRAAVMLRCMLRFAGNGDYSA